MRPETANGSRIHELGLMAMLCCSVMSAHGDELGDQLALDIRVAEQSILASLASHRSSGSKYLCAQNLYACTGADDAELGLALIGGSRSPIAARSLIELSRFKMDAGLSEAFDCYVGYRGGAVVRLINSVDVKKLSQQCYEELATFKVRARARYDVRPEDVCRTPSEIASGLRELSEVAASDESCEVP